MWRKGERKVREKVIVVVEEMGIGRNGTEWLW